MQSSKVYDEGYREEFVKGCAEAVRRIRHNMREDFERTGANRLMTSERYYAIAIRATKTGKDFRERQEMLAGAVWAHSDEEAMGLALNIAKREWPIGKGWYNHSATYCRIEIPRAQVEALNVEPGT